MTACLAFCAAAYGQPPYQGTVFVEPAILTPADPTAFKGLSNAGRGMRTMFDRRVPGWANLNAFLFSAEFSDGQAVEVQVNPEFGQEEALLQAEKYLPVIGQLPRAVRTHVKTVWIHRGKKSFGGGNSNLMIHTGQGEEYLKQGVLAEALFHEAAHTSLDAHHATAEGWLSAQKGDGRFISYYARANPGREDVAESFLMYFAVRHKRERMRASLLETVERTIPNRITYFDALKLDMRPTEGHAHNGQDADRDRTPARTGALPGHHSYGSVSGGSADQAGESQGKDSPSE